jgi:hypothetical protein
MRHSSKRLAPARFQPGRVRSHIISLSLRAFALLLILGSISQDGLAALINRKLSGVLPDTSNVLSIWAVSPDGEYAAFISDKLVDGKFELYSVRLGGGGPTRISGTLADTLDVMDLIITPDNQRVMYATRMSSEVEPTGLWSVPIGGGTPVPLGPTMEAGDYFDSFIASPDSQYAVYLIKNLSSDKETLYAIPISGGIPIDLSPGICETENCTFSRYVISPNSAKVVFSYAWSMGAILRAIPITGGTFTEFSPNYVHEFLITSDSLRVVYKAGLPADLYTSLLETGAFQPPLDDLSGGNVLALTSDNTRVVYTNNDALFSVPIAGGASPTPLSGSLVEDGCVTDFQLTPDGAYAIYLADQLENDKFELFAVPTDGSTDKFKLNGNLTVNGDVLDFQIAPNSLVVVYRADQDQDEVIELYGWSAGNVYQLNGALVVPGGDVTGFAIFPNSLGVVYRADQEVNERFELYAWTTAVGTAFKLNGDLVTNGDVSEFTVTPDSLGAVYRADQLVESKNELFITLSEYPAYLPLVSR